VAHGRTKLKSIIFRIFPLREKNRPFMANILNVDNLEKNYSSGSRDLKVLDGVSFEIASGETFSIVGPSGSGKTTLLGLCAGLDQSDTGTIELCGEDLMSLSEDERALLRNRKVGFIFQDFQLLPTLTALENVMLPLELLQEPHPQRTAEDLLHRVGLGERLHHYPNQLSGGEQQRCAIARAFVTRPRCLIADEPTGNLDSETGRRIIDLLFELNAEQGTTLIMATHDATLASRCRQRIRLEAGRLIDDTTDGRSDGTIDDGSSAISEHGK
jgi:putative ABC transport system ATP-binding protein